MPCKVKRKRKTFYKSSAAGRRAFIRLSSGAFRAHARARGLRAIAARAARLRDRRRAQIGRFDALLPPDHNRACDSNRGVSSEDDADQECDGKSEQDFAAEEHHREHGEKDEAGSNHRARERLVDRVVGDVVERFAPVQAAVFAYPVKDDDGIVDGKADQRQQRGDHRQADLPLKDREESERHQHVVKNRDDRRRAIRPLKAKGDVHQDADEREQGDGNRLIAKLASGDGADRVRAQDFISGIRIRVQIFVVRGFGAKGVESLFHLVASDVHLRLILSAAASLLRQLDEDLIGLIGDGLNDCVLHADFGERATDGFRRRTLFELSRDDCAALEIHAEVKSLRPVRMNYLTENGGTQAYQHEQQRDGDKNTTIRQPVNLNVFKKLNHNLLKSDK